MNEQTARGTHAAD